MKGILCLETESYRECGLADACFGNCKDTRRSAGCMLITIGESLIEWHVAMHGALSNSATEDEHKELEKLAKGMEFMQMLLTELNLVGLPGHMFEENVGAISYLEIFK